MQGVLRIIGESVLLLDINHKSFIINIDSRIQIFMQQMRMEPRIAWDASCALCFFNFFLEIIIIPFLKEITIVHNDLFVIINTVLREHDCMDWSFFMGFNLDNRTSRDTMFKYLPQTCILKMVFVADECELLLSRKHADDMLNHCLSVNLDERFWIRVSFIKKPFPYS